MRLFQRNKDLDVQSFILRLVNASCPEMHGQLQGPRLERRVNLALVVLVVPLEKKELVVKESFAGITKDFSSTGLSVILNQPCGLDEVLLGFRWSGGVTWIRAQAKHLTPIGGGFYQLGFRMVEKVSAGDYPELDSITF